MAKQKSYEIMFEGTHTLTASSSDEAETKLLEIFEKVGVEIDVTEIDEAPE